MTLRQVSVKNFRMAAIVRPRFVDEFESAWSSRNPDRLVSLLHPEVRLIQPLVSEIRGREAARRSFASLIELIPDLKTEVTGWSGGGDTIFIEFTFSGTAGKRPVRLHLVDKFTLNDGLALRRESYFDPLPLLRAVIVQPQVLWKFIRSMRD